MLKDELKVGLIFVKKGQQFEEEFFTNTEHSEEFDVFLGFLGDKVKLKGFKGYSGGLDIKHSLTGEYSIYKEWKNFKVMFHVATLLPMDEHDDLKVFGSCFFQNIKNNKFNLCYFLMKEIFFVDIFLKFS